MHGGKRIGAGRPFGTKKDETVVYYRRIKPEFVELMDKYLNELKSKKTD
jgi:hypothetical protein